MHESKHFPNLIALNSFVNATLVVTVVVKYFNIFTWCIKCISYWASTHQDQFLVTSYCVEPIISNLNKFAKSSHTFTLPESKLKKTMLPWVSLNEKDKTKHFQLKAGLEDSAPVKCCPSHVSLQPSAKLRYCSHISNSSNYLSSSTFLFTWLAIAPNTQSINGHTCSCHVLAQNINQHHQFPQLNKSVV